MPKEMSMSKEMSSRMVVADIFTCKRMRSRTPSCTITGPQRHANGGRTRFTGRRRLGDFQADQRPGERAQLL